MLAALGLGRVAIPLPQRFGFLARLGEPVDRRFLETLPLSPRQLARRDIGRGLRHDAACLQQRCEDNRAKGAAEKPNHDRSLGVRGIASHTTGTPISSVATPTKAPSPV